MFKQRLITALLLLPLAVVLLFYPSLQNFSLILIPIFGVLAWEWSGLLKSEKSYVRWELIILTLGFIGYLFYQLYQAGFFQSPGNVPDFNASFSIFEANPLKKIVVGNLVWILALVLVLLYPNGTKLWSKGASIKIFMGAVILPVAWLAIVLIRSSQYETDVNYGGFLLLLMFFIIWGADVGAYLTGKTFGKNKLAPVVSPNKTWEGFFGGLITSLLVAWALGTYMGLPLPLKYFIPFVLILGIVSVIGDLFISMLKRQADIKDTSNILPGHGGLLDRLDSTLSVAPFFVILLLWLNGGL